MFEIIELGHFSLILALGIAIAKPILAIFSARQKSLYIAGLVHRATQLTFILISLAFVSLGISFLHNDFSVSYIVQHSNTYLPWYYKLSAIWAGHEGSLLLWVWLLSLWSFCVALKMGILPPAFRANVLATLGVIQIGFLSFILFSSSPFIRLLPTGKAGGFPLQGKDLNPLLQDIGLIIHPPLLYMGYVGFAVAFAFVVAALIEGRLDTTWARWCRSWTMCAWAFLTLGIAVGSWWAYNELGWGGWWFWDPVENASLMPWLCATALIHSLSATQKRNVFKVWTAFLMTTTFTLSLIGTFLVRSGVLTSVHAFASDPTRGIYLLILLSVISGGAFLLLIFRSHKLRSTGQFDWLSKEMGILINNFLLATACLIVLVGTLAPLLYDVLGWTRISVGAAYFNAKMLWVLLLSLVFLCFAPYLRWKRDVLSRQKWSLLIAVIAAFIGSYLLIKYFEYFNWQAFLLIALTSSALFVALIDAYRESTTSRFFKLPPFSYLAMFIAHVGFLVCCIGIVLSTFYSSDKDLYLKRGQTIKLRDLSFEMGTTHIKNNDLYQSLQVDFLLRDDKQKTIDVLFPEKRHYHLSQMPMTESAIHSGLTRDVYIALGEPQENGAWSVRLQIKPFIRWIWLGALLMAFAAVFVWGDRRGKLRRKS